jgi:DNA-binding winged helix-turn-helix (wHTH) protein
LILVMAFCRCNIMQKIAIVHCCGAGDAPLGCLEEQTNNHQQNVDSIYSLETLLGAEITAYYFQYGCGPPAELAVKLVKSTLIFFLIDEDKSDNNAETLSLITHTRTVNQADIFILALPNQTIKSHSAYYAGADQFMRFPFDFDEINARTYALIQREKRKAVKPFDYSQLVFTPAQSIIMSCLVEHPSKVISKQVLQQIVGRKKFHAHDRNLDMHISNIRQKLLRAGYKKSLIKTVRNLGYVFDEITLGILPADKDPDDIAGQS